jgi:hypothetical protein
MRLSKPGTKSWALRFWIIAVMALVLASFCRLAAVANIASQPVAIRGSGTVITENRPVGHFERVSLSDLGVLIISQGAEEALIVETDDNIVRYVETRVRSGTLVLGFGARVRGSAVWPSKGITYHLSIRQVAGLEAADAGRIRALALDARYLEIRARDSGSVEIDSLTAGTLQARVEDYAGIKLAGRVDRQEVTGQDSGRYLASRLQSRTADVVASDSAQATVWATEALGVTVVDSGHVLYRGSPRCTQHVSDKGTLARLSEP